MNRTIYFNPEKKGSLTHFSNTLLRYIKKTKKDNQTLVLVCIGTDRATGDCLGPLVGHYLAENLSSELPIVYGNLSEPVHAANLIQTLDSIHMNIQAPYIIVIDACLGCADHVGYVTLSNRPLEPGRGVHKLLPALGHISITGIVDEYGTENYHTIQNTHLYEVVKLATFIANGITDLISYHHL